MTLISLIIIFRCHKREIARDRMGHLRTKLELWSPFGAALGFLQQCLFCFFIAEHELFYFLKWQFKVHSILLNQPLLLPMPLNLEDECPWFFAAFQFCRGRERDFTFEPNLFLFLQTIHLPPGLALLIKPCFSTL